MPTFFLRPFKNIFLLEFYLYALTHNKFLLTHNKWVRLKRTHFLINTTSLPSLCEIHLV